MALQPGMVGRVLRALAVACALLGGACGDDDEAADSGEGGRRADSGPGGGGSERDASADEPQSGSGGRASGGSRAAGSGGSGGRTAADSGDGGAGGRQGNAGAGAGGTGSDCPAGKREALEAFCSMDHAMCGLTFEQRRESYCGSPSCSSASCAVFEMKSSCGGRAIGTILGGDAFSEFAYYDANGTLVGVEVQRPNPAHPCVIFDAYGETCERIESKMVDCSAIVDAGL